MKTFIINGIDMIGRLVALTTQEKSSCYSTCKDYLSIIESRNLDDSTVSTVSTVEDQQKDHAINESWREKICEWLYDVVDHFGYSREIVYTTLNLFDRYLFIYSHNSKPVTPKIVQLIAVSALNLTLKVQDSKLDHLPMLLELSQNFFSAKHVTATERSILDNLSWKISPPTPFAFLQHFLELMPKDDNVTGLLLTRLESSAQFLVELSVCDYYFVGLKPSSIALASLLSSIDSILPSEVFAMRTKTLLLHDISNIAGISYSEEIRQCQLYLEDVFLSCSEYNSPVTDNDEQSHNRGGNSSPVSIVPPEHPPSSRLVTTSYVRAFPNQGGY
jgi:hypothetical protein